MRLSLSAKSQMTPKYLKHSSETDGFTLVEVLVALVITGICAAVAVGKTTESSSHYRVLEERTYASWVAQNEIAKHRLSKTPPAPGGDSNIVEMGRREWQVDSQITEIEDGNLYKVLIEVSPNRLSNGNGKTNTFSMSGFLSKPPSK